MRHFRQIRSFVLPITAAVIVPFLIIARYDPFRLDIRLPLPALQAPLGLAFFLAGLALLVLTVRLFHSVGQGTLAPWDPPRRLVTRGVYRYVRNPMISGVLFMLLGEAILGGSQGLFTWFILFLVINTTYFKLLEEPGLVRRFGQDYITYRQHVPMWIPRLKPWEPEE
jgi:protein-S-isoprenylcysteine O-methyltransferase Ste14